MKIIPGGIYKLPKHGLIYHLEAHKEYPDRYWIKKHEFVYRKPANTATSVGPIIFKIGILITANKYEFIE